MTPSPESVLSWFTVLEKGGLLLVFMVLAVGQAWAYYKRWVVPGWLLVERDRQIATIQAERDRRVAALEGEVVQWRTMALQSLGLSARFAAVALPELPPLKTPSTPTTPEGS